MLLPLVYLCIQHISYFDATADVKKEVLIVKDVDPRPIDSVDKTSRSVAVATDTAMIQNDSQSEPIRVEQ